MGAVFDAQPQKLVDGGPRSFSGFHGLLETGPTLRHGALLEVESFTDSIPVDLQDRSAYCSNTFFRNA
jgi:hypothetical protein